MISESFRKLLVEQCIKIPEDRKDNLKAIAKSIKSAISTNNKAIVQFVCTHNSRRSQAAEFLLDLFARTYKLPIVAYSSGTEYTAFYPTMVKALKSFGFEFLEYGFKPNPLYIYRVKNEDNYYYSKTYEDKFIQDDAQIIVTVCGSAEKNCPFIPGTFERFHLGFEDPKHSDGTAKELETYQNKVVEIGAELFFLTSELNPNNT